MNLSSYSPSTYFRWILTSLIVFTAVFTFEKARAYTRAERVALQRSIVDEQRSLNSKFKKVKRKKTKYIIVHTSEGGLTSTLRSVLKGKNIRGQWYTRGGHAHYVIARNGRIYRTLNKKYKADHAGMSMWNGETNLSAVSIGIELVGFHYTNITNEQYRSLGILLDILQDAYDLDDRAVLTHSQVAYGKPNRWIKQPHRGRKRCAKNFDRAKAGLGPTWSYDPDVKTGRLKADPALSNIYYASRPAPAEGVGSNVITSKNTAWTIAGEEYDSPTTLYILPNGKTVPGDHMEKTIGWNRVPKNTVVLLNKEKGLYAEKNPGPVKRISNGATAWDFAGAAYNKKTTFYFFPGGRVKNGKEISDWDELPTETRMIVGYRGPFEVTGKRPPSQIAGTKYNHRNTLYYYPNEKISPGNTVKDFRMLPKGVMMFVPVKG
jgi:hypothetical protein